MARPITVFAAVALPLSFLLLAAPGLQPAHASSPITIADCSEAALDSALAAAHSGDTILWQCVTGDAGPKTTLLTSQKAINKALTIVGLHPPTGERNVLSGGNDVRLFRVEAGGALTLTDIVVERGYVEGDDGGCLLVYGSLRVEDALLRWCSAAGEWGGAIQADGATVELVDMEMRSNGESDILLTGAGGALSAWDSSVLVDGVTFYGNHASGPGGAIYISRSDLTLRRSGFDGNGSYFQGGAIAAYDTVAWGSVLTFTDNYAEQNGGALSLGGAVGSRAYLTDVVMAENAAMSNGGGIDVGSTSALSLVRAEIRGNRAHLDGGGLYSEGGDVSISQSAILLNRTYDPSGLGRGGGICITGTAALTITGSQLDGNTVHGSGYGGGVYVGAGKAVISGSRLEYNGGASEGGGIYVGEATLNLTDVGLRGNQATVVGGGIAASGSEVNALRVAVTGHDSGLADGAGISCINCSGLWQEMAFSGNKARAVGGGLLAAGGTLTIRRSLFDHNTAGLGGGLFNWSGDLELSNVTLSANSAITEGGGIYNANGWGTASSVTLVNATLKDNAAATGGAVFNGASNTQLTLKNSVLADSPSGGSCGGRPPDSSKYSLSTDASCMLAGTGDYEGGAAGLSPLALVGGSTAVHLPRADSWLVNRVVGADYPSLDQRGVARPQPAGGSADVGAVERRSIDPAYPPVAFLPVVARQ